MRLQMKTGIKIEHRDQMMIRPLKLQEFFYLRLALCLWKRFRKEVKSEKLETSEPRIEDYFKISDSNMTEERI